MRRKRERDLGVDYIPCGCLEILRSKSSGRFADMRYASSNKMCPIRVFESDGLKGDQFVAPSGYSVSGVVTQRFMHTAILTSATRGHRCNSQQRVEHVQFQIQNVFSQYALYVYV